MVYVNNLKFKMNEIPNLEKVKNKGIITINSYLQNVTCFGNK